MPLTPLDRVRTALAHEEPDHAPCDDAFFVDTRARFLAEGMPADVRETDYFDFDFENLSLDASPRLPERLIEETEEQRTYVSKSGYSAVVWKKKSGALHYFDHATKTKQDWERIKGRLVVDVDGTARISSTGYFAPFMTYPSWEGAADEYRGLRETGRFMLLGFYGPFEATWRHHGYVETCMDLLQEGDWVADMFNSYTDLVCAVLRRGLEAGIRPDGVFLIEDLGTTHGTLFSPEAFREFIKPCYARICDLARAEGLSRFLHSDGGIHAILDDLVEVGIEALNPIDTGSGMDLVDLKRRYGKALTFFGGVSARNMHDVEKSNAEIDRAIPVAAKGGGYIYHSDHSVPPTVSLARYREILARVRKRSSKRSLSRKKS
ncbi:MAG: uroporphyrinogen decarboxylase family protein [Planctomycetota bacterium]